MGFGDPLGFFNAGQAAGKQSASPFEIGANNVMDVFKANIESQMKIAQTAALFKGEKNYEYGTDPTKIGAQKQLNELNALQGGSPQAGGSSVAGPSSMGGPIAGDTSKSNDASKPKQKGALDGSTATKVDIMGHTFENQGAEVTKQVAQKEIDSSAADARSAALMMQKMDDLRDLHDRAMKAPGVSRASSATPSPFGLATRASQLGQAATLDMQGPDNPDWQNYEAAKKNFSYMADRGLFGEKGKLIGQQLDAGQLLWPSKNGTKEGDQGLWNILYALPQSTIDYHNTMVDKYLGSDSPIKVKANSRYSGNSEPGKWNEIAEQAKIQGLIADNPDKKDALMARYNQRKKEATSNG